MPYGSPHPGMLLKMLITTRWARLSERLHALWSGNFQSPVGQAKRGAWSLGPGQPPLGGFQSLKCAEAAEGGGGRVPRSLRG